MNTLKNKHLKKLTKHIPLQPPFVSNAIFTDHVCLWNSELPHNSMYIQRRMQFTLSFLQVFYFNKRCDSFENRISWFLLFTNFLFIRTMRYLFIYWLHEFIQRRQCFLLTRPNNKWIVLYSYIGQWILR